ncbi:sensor histidine kinase [Actinoplanes rectilineatus]|uniref:sensor histidine kinase n=1 Tax=Actinoplanes rectilineatus TaxID=113571 RepID=UPI0005F2E727|nr:histidine kinase [Actinoplanes rectilineatus]
MAEHRWLIPSSLVADPDGPAPVRRSTRDWVVDGLCVAVAVGFAVILTLNLINDPSNGVPRWWDTPRWLSIADGAAGVVAGLSLWWRRRFLAAVAGYHLVLSLFTLAGAVSILVVILTVGVHRRFAVLAGYLAAIVASNFVFAGLRHENGQTYWETVGWGTAFVIIVALWGMVLRTRRQLIVSWRERAERAESEQRLRVAQAQVLERTRIAREMHDVLAHRISLISLHAGAIEFRPDAPPDEIAGAAAVVRASAHQALQDLRAVIGVLRTGAQSDDVPERPQPTLSALPALVDETRSSGSRVRLAVSAALDEVPATTGLTAYRIVQEGLTNARKHAPGTAVGVAVDGDPGDGLTIEIRNPMPATAPARPIPGTGVGLVGLAERAGLAGGRITHGPADGDFVLTAWLPWTVP